jgi:hypothetical protein
MVKFMKVKLLFASVLLSSFVGAAQASMSYECWTYVNGHPDKYINRSADNNAEAVRKATEWFRSNGNRFDYIKCK